jgi:hypothetical protein
MTHDLDGESNDYKQQEDNNEYEDEAEESKREEEDDAADNYEPEQSNDYANVSKYDGDAAEEEEREEETSLADGVYGAYLNERDGGEEEEVEKVAEEEGNEQEFAFPRFKTSEDSDTNEKKSNMTVQDDKEPKSLYRGGLRGSNSSGSKNSFGRQEPEDDKVADMKEDLEEEEKEEEEVAKSSGDGIEVIDEGKLFYNNQSPLEVPNSVEKVDADDKSTRSKDENSVVDVKNTQRVEPKTETKTDDYDDKVKKENLLPLPESSGDVTVNFDEDKTFYKKQPPLEVPNSVEEVKVGDKYTKMTDKGNSVDDEKKKSDPFIVPIKKNGMIDGVDDAKIVVEDDSEGFSSKEKAAFEAKYGNNDESMNGEENKEEASEKIAVDNVMFKDQSPLKIPTVAADVPKKSQNSAASLHEKRSSVKDVMDEQPKSMADVVDKEEKERGDVDLKVKKLEDSEDDTVTVKKRLNESESHTTVKDKLMKEDLDSEEEKMRKDDVDNDGTPKMDEDAPTQADSKVEKSASLVENSFKEFLITNSEDEPKKDQNLGDVDEAPVDMDKDISTFEIKDEKIGKFDESEEVVGAEKVGADANERKKEGSSDASERLSYAEDPTKVKNASSIPGAIVETGDIKDIGDSEALLSTRLANSKESVVGVKTADAADEEKELTKEINKNDKSREAADKIKEAAFESVREVVEGSEDPEEHDDNAREHSKTIKVTGGDFGDSIEVSDTAEAGGNVQPGVEESEEDEKNEVAKKKESVTREKAAADSGELIYAKISKTNEFESEDSLLDKENEVFPIHGNLGEGIKKSDAEGDLIEEASDVRSSKLDTKDTKNVLKSSSEKYVLLKKKKKKKE